MVSYVSYSDKEPLSILFNIDDVVFKTFQEVSNCNRDNEVDIGYQYIDKFKKKITVDDFDCFIASNLDLKTKRKILNLFDIDINTSANISGWSKEQVRISREKNTQFNRDLKIKLLCQ